MKIKSYILVIIFLSAILSGYFFIRMKSFYILLFIFAFLGALYFLTKRVYSNYLFFLVPMLFFISSFLVNSFNLDLTFKIFSIICLIMLGCFLYFWKETNNNEGIFVQLLYVGAVINMFGIYEFFLNDFIFKKYMATSYLVKMSDVAYESYRIRTFFNHPIIYGNFLVVLFCLNLYLNRNRIFFYVLNLLIISNLIMSQSRSSWISLIIVYLFYVFRLKINKIKDVPRKVFNPQLKMSLIFIYPVILLSIGFLNLEFFIKVYNQMYSRIFDLQTSYGSISYFQRTFAIDAISNEVFLKSGFINLFFGHGLGSSGDFMSEQIFSYLKGFSTTDNTYLDILYDFGLIGFAIYILFFINITVYFFKRKVSRFFLCNYLIFLSIAINSFFYSILGWDVILFFFILSIIFMILEKNYYVKNSDVLN